MNETLSKRAIACPGFRWMPGMAFTATNTSHGYTSTGRVQPSDINAGSPTNGSWEALPDMSDPATLGCLLALVREAWCDPAASAEWRGSDGWWVWQSDPGAGPLARGWPSEAEALVAALEAAPRPA